MKVQRVMNEFGMVVKVFCASCKYKDVTRAYSLRYCNDWHRDVKPCDVCKLWQMSDQLKKAGQSQGLVKCHEYQMFLLEVREKEMQDILSGKRVKVKSIMEIRAEFEKKYGSIYCPM